MRKKKALGIIAAIFIILFVSAMGVLVVSLLGSSSQSSINYLFSQKAFYVAEGGLEYYIEQLENQAASWTSPPTKPTNEALGGGTFTITTSNEQDNEIDVVSTASITGPDSIVITREAALTVTRSASSPASFSYVTRSESTLNFTDSTGTINGDISAGGSISGTSGLTLNGTEYPNTSVAFPEVDLTNYQTDADHVISGNYTFASGTYSGIYYITGNVTFESNVVLNGSVIVPSANKTVSTTNTDSVTINASGNYPAIASAGAITLSANKKSSSNLTINGLVFTSKNANPSINLRKAENFTFDGAMVSMGKIDLREMINLNMTLDSDIAANPPPYFSDPGSGGVSISNWDEVY